jgi:DNA-binding NarL/FixJ family response regulator
VAHPARRGPAVAVPIWWRGDVIAVNVVFASLDPHRVDEVEALSQSAAAAIVESGRSPAAPSDKAPRRSPFTPREAEVLGLLRQGLTYREMAGRLGLSAKTVEKHVGAIMRKTGAKNRTAAVVAAMDMGDLPHTAGGRDGA